MGVFIDYELIFIIYIAFFDGFKLLGQHSSTVKRGCALCAYEITEIPAIIVSYGHMYMYIYMNLFNCL